MMVPSLDQQAAVLVETVQNHTPEIVIVDEIGRESEVEAVQTVKERGVRCFGSAHGSLRRLVDNKILSGLVGGVELVTVGDSAAQKRQRAVGGELKKTWSNRAGAPIFDVVIELSQNNKHEWTVTKDVATAVDSILAGKKYKAEVRRRQPDTGAISLELVWR
jgi:stage III sporulation protein SpoIIIAA